MNDQFARIRMIYGASAMENYTKQRLQFLALVVLEDILSKLLQEVA